MLKKLANARKNAIQNKIRPLMEKRRALNDDQQERLEELDRAYRRWSLITG
ncbi:MAG: hypothetical protein ABJN26_15980 [Stappiaceae bacterium]